MPESVKLATPCMIAPLRERSRWVERLPGDLPITYWWLWLGTLVNRMGGFVIPMLALYLRRDLGLPGPRVGEILSAYGIGGVCAGLVGGVCADRFGRRATMTASLIAGGVILGVVGFVKEPFWLVPAVFAYGFIGDMYRPAVFAAVADLVPEDRRARAYGYLYWAVNLGFAIAPLVGGVLAEKSFILCFTLDGATMILFGLVVRARVPETLGVARTEAQAKGTGGGLLQVLADRPFVGLVLGNLFMAIIVWGATVVLPLQTDAYGLSTAAYGRIIAVNGVLIVLLQPWWTGHADRFRPTAVLVASGLLFGVGHGVNAFAHHELAFMGATTIWTIGEIIATPILSAMIAGMAPADMRGRYQGVFGTSWALAAALGPILGGRVVGGLPYATIWFAAFGLGLVSALTYGLAGPVAERRIRARRVVI